MEAQAKAWIDAMGGEMEGDSRCGCEPMRQYIEVFYSAKIHILSVLTKIGTMGPVKIPISFQDDHTFEGEGFLPYHAVGIAGTQGGACSVQSNGGMQIKVTGNAIEEEGGKGEAKHEMNIQVTNVTPQTGGTTANCPGRNFFAPLQGADKASFSFKLYGALGEQGTKQVPLAETPPLPVHSISLHAE